MDENAAPEVSSLNGRLEETALGLGATKAAVIPACRVETDASFRDLCKANVCGNYGRSWMCPPHVGEIGELMAQLGKYDSVLVFQTISALEDSYDFEGMMDAAEKHNRLMSAVREKTDAMPLGRTLHLGAGGCRMCKVCAKKTGEPCRNPDRAVASLETYGVNVSTLAKTAGMKSINGQNTVTYFGAVLFEY